MRIAVDFDGVIVDTGKIKAEAAKRYFGIDFPAGRFKAEFVVASAALTVREYRAVTRIVSMKGLGLSLEPMKEAVEYILRLQAEGHELGVVTSRDEEFLETAIEWSTQHQLSIPFRGVGHEKSKATALVDYEVFLDDDLNKLTDLVGIVPYLFLFSHEYNLHHKLPREVVRVHSWREFYNHIQRLSGRAAIAAAG